MPNPRSLTHPEACAALQPLAGEFAVLPNHGTLFPPYDVVPLGARYPQPDGPLRAMLMDMDGTTTLTEDLCIAALSSSLRDASTDAFGRPRVPSLDSVKDFPHIIGTSASANIAYLVEVYGSQLNRDSFRRCFARASVWNLNPNRDPIRRAEAETTVRICGAESWLDSPSFQALMEKTDKEPLPNDAPLSDLLSEVSASLRFDSTEQIGRALLDIYYEYLHGYFAAIIRDEGWRVAEAVYGDRHRPAIAPLPGITLACALTRGLLANHPDVAVQLAGALNDQVPTKVQAEAIQRAARQLAIHPPKIALVTSSGYYEARTVLHEVFRGMRLEVEAWPLPEPIRGSIIHEFRSPEAYYDAIITADESHEIRLKPYRDLYTIAIRNLGLDEKALRNTIGFEDTWAGVTAMRAAGIGIPCAVPFHGSRSHDFSLASHVFPGGLPEAILQHALFGASPA